MKDSKVKEILDLAIPATLENLLQTLVGFIDTLMISKLGLIAVTAVGVANSVLAVYLAVFIAIGVGASSLISRKLGEGDTARASRVVVQSTVLSIIIGFIFSIVSVLFGRNLLSLMGTTEETLELSFQFFGIVGVFSILSSLSTTWGSVLRASGDTKSPLFINGLVNVLNVLIDTVLIFGLGPIPALGVVGTAIGTVVSKLIGCILLYKQISKTSIRFNFKSLFIKDSYQELVSLTIPAAAERLVMRLGQVVYFGIIVAISLETYAAHTIAGNIESFTYMPAFGLSTAVATLVGRSVGQKDYQSVKEYTKKTCIIGVTIMGSMGIIMAISSPFFANLFTSDAQAIERVINALKIDMFTQPFLAISFILTGSLQAMGDTKSPLYSTMFGMWVVRVTGVYILSIVYNFDIAGVWLSIGIDILLRSIYLSYVFNKKHNKLVNI